MELDGGPAGITENTGYEGISSGPSKLEAGHLPVFEPRGGVISGALSNTGIYRKIKQGLRWLHGSLFLLRCKLERPCGEGVEGFHGSVVERSARSAGCETERTLKPGNDRLVLAGIA